MKVFDMHCDTISAIYDRQQKGESIHLKRNALHLDIEKMQKGDYGLQTFALFVNQAEAKDCFEKACQMLHVFQKEVQANQEQISQVFTYQDIEENEKAGKISALLSLEEGAIFEESLERLRWFYEQGVRMATFTWNHENALGYPNCMRDPVKERPWSFGEMRGLKKRGLEFLEEMETLHMIPDVSHLSDGGFWDVASHAKRPFVASHSNARGVAKEAARNLTDEMLRALAEKGGVMGLNYCVPFVREVWNPGEEGASISELIRQVQYIVQIGGEECLGLGSDFDGIQELPQMGGAEGMEKLAEAMERAGLSYTQIEKIFYKNVKRFLRENL